MWWFTYWILRFTLIIMKMRINSKVNERNEDARWDFQYTRGVERMYVWRQYMRYQPNCIFLMGILQSRSVQPQMKVFKILVFALTSTSTTFVLFRHRPSPKEIELKYKINVFDLWIKLTQWTSLYILVVLSIINYNLWETLRNFTIYGFVW